VWQQFSNVYSKKELILLKGSVGIKKKHNVKFWLCKRASFFCYNNMKVYGQICKKQIIEKW
jgi:hypothetical protein